jgi:hypothetical protein
LSLRLCYAEQKNWEEMDYLAKGEDFSKWQGKVLNGQKYTAREKSR